MKEIEIIKKTIKKLLSFMGFEGEVEVDDSQKDNISVNIQSEEAGFLIGQAGANLEAFQHIARMLVNKENEQPIQFVLDVNQYRKHHVELLKELAKNMARQSLTEKVSITLQPMSAYDRRIIHLTLAEDPQINTASVGQGEERRVVVKPVK